MNCGAGEPLHKLESPILFTAWAPKRKTVLFIFNLDETARQTMTN